MQSNSWWKRFAAYTALAYSAMGVAYLIVEVI